jgi:DNA-directed RNA polymerase specialized sigma24 family protein
MTQREVASGRQGPNASRAILPCVMDDRAGGRRAPPRASAAPPPSAVERVVDLYERHVADALKAVEAHERECIELTYFGGLSVDEVAARCEMSVTAVDDRLRRGLNDMLRYLRAQARQEAGARP